MVRNEAAGAAQGKRMAFGRTRIGGRWLAAGCALATLAVAAQAQAQDGEGDASEITVIGERRAYEVDAIATALKTDTPLRDTPQAVTAITRDLIDDQGLRSFADIARYTPGLSMGQGEGHRDAPTLRGNASTADFFVDGVRDDVQYFRDLYNAARIEVLKGPNAMIFGRGGGGGVINRVTEWAGDSDAREVTLTLDEFGQRRATLDLGGDVSETAALRLNAVYEFSESYRDFVNLERYGLNPTAAFSPGDSTELRIGYEYLFDNRTVDRGVPSRNGRPVEIDESTFFGNPLASYAEAEVHLIQASLEHEFGPGLTLRNRTEFGDYDKYYANVHANGPVSVTDTVALQAYNSSTGRQNLFTQTDLIWKTQTGSIGHTILAGFELGHQDTDNTRAPNNNNAGTVTLAQPQIFTAPVFLAPLQNDNQVDVGIAALYLQDQIALSEAWQIVLGVRFDRFELDFDDRRAANADFSRTDEFISPRAGLIFKPAENLSLYASYSVSSLPQSGDQFASLTAITAGLEPEEFENVEAGVKWEMGDALAFTAAIYRLDRTNTPALDPATNTTVLTGEQRSEGLELSLAGAITDRWDVLAGYAYQNVEITKTTSAAPAGRILPLTPEHTASLWNRVRFTPRWSAGLGVTYQDESFAAISNAVTLPSFTRVDGALYFTPAENIELQLNVDNLLDETYWPTAHNDNNITPGAPRTFRVTLRSRF
jgi:catecholate siderophore receptor